MMTTLSELTQLTQSRSNILFQHYLVERKAPSSALSSAMAYTVLQGGKRLRPLLVYATGITLDVPLEKLDAAACALELIHAYSLIHDDLPAMDNSDLRRGQPTCHKVYGDAMAILAGDALQTLAFQILATHPAELSAEERLSMIQTLSEASGSYGMAGGQALDITMMHTPISLEQLTYLYQLKTGALLNASVKMATLAVPALNKNIQVALNDFAHHLGDAFQIQDDLLDVTGNAHETGKPIGLDAINLKTTYPTLLGIEKTKLHLEHTYEHAIKALSPLGERAKLLQEIAESLINRKS